MESAEENDSHITLTEWCKEDKLCLLRALKTHGSKNISHIHTEIPTKSCEQIIRAVNYYKIRAAKIKTSKNRRKEKSRPRSNPRIPLASWAKFLTDSLSYKELQTESVSAIRIIADLENHPPAACTENVNFKKIYHQIANAMEGKPIPEDKMTNCILKKCLLETALISKAFIRNSTFKFLMDSINISEQEINAFPKPTFDHELSTIRHLAAQRNYNPLNVPEYFLKPSISRDPKPSHT